MRRLVPTALLLVATLLPALVMVGCSKHTVTGQDTTPPHRWVLLSSAPITVTSLAVSGNYLVAASGSTPYGVFRTADNGDTWTQAVSGLGDAHVYALEANGTSLFAGTRSGVFRSNDDGETWSPANNGIPSLDYAKQHTLVLAFAASGTTLLAGTSAGIYRSADNGTSWDSCNTGLPTPYAIGALCTSGTTLFAGGYYGGMFRSTNGGDNWTAVTDTPWCYICSNSTCTVQAFAANATTVFAATSDGVYRSTDNGTSWTLSNTGQTQMYVLSLVAHDKSVFAGTYVYNGGGPGGNVFA